MKRILSTASLLLATAVMNTGCGNGSTSYSLLGTGQTFQQSPVAINNKIDILWVVDNSGSMDPLQTEMTANFNAFITRFQGLGYDYNMAVTTTDSYLAASNYRNQPALARVRDGAAAVHTGFFFITPLIPNIVTNFVKNATQGSAGSGDERAFQSMLVTLNSPLNTDFRRADAYLAVVILSDEDDFTDTTRPENSWLFRGGVADHSYTNPNMPSVDTIIGQMDTITSSVPANRHYNVSAITVMDTACQTAHRAQSSTTIIGARYIELADKTNGVTGSICDPTYATSLDFIQQNILELSTEFKLNAKPVVATLSVVVDGVTIPQDSINGWTYQADVNSIRFHGTAVPAASAQVIINFEPETLAF